MGKKRIIQKSKEETLKKTHGEGITEEKSGLVGKRKHENGRIYIQATYNNTIMTVTDEKGGVITWMSSGALGFSGPKKATPFAASKVAEAITEKVQKSGPVNVEVFIKGVGGGRDAAVRSLSNKGFNIKIIRDVTPIPHNGPRPPKPRRV